MFNEEVNIDFNANVAPFSSSLTQAINQLGQFSAGADTAMGSLSKLSGISVALIKHTGALTQANKTATAQAAAYQQQLHGVNATAQLAGKQFDNLAKVTKGFARDFPVGMSKAIETTNSLAKAGVTSTKEIEKLGKTFIGLQAATGEWGTGMVQDMLQITRSFGNGTKTVGAFADSLSTVTAKYGASATSVVAFSKAIAPIASVVGISQSSVFGLSTAFSRMGEDGYRSANALNKILLDMNRSVRTGSPEIREYAKAMGMTTESLTSMFKSDPTETFLRFTEAIKKQGPDSIRTLDALGLEGIATFKALQVTSAPDLREIVATSNQAYGNGSTQEAAKKAMGGVNDEMTKLGETMSQTLAEGGTPFLGMLEKILQVANKVAGVFNAIAQNPLAKAFAVAAVAAGVLLKTMSAMSAINFARLAASPMIGGFRAGQAAAMGGIMQTGAAAAAGAAAGDTALMTRRAQMMYNLGQGPAGQAFNNAGGGIRGVARGIGNMALWGGTAGMNMSQNWLRYSPEQQVVRTEAGKALSSNLAAAKIDPATGGAASIGQQLKGMTSAFATFGKTISGVTVTTGSQFAGLGAAAKGLTGAFIRSGVELTIAVGKVALTMIAQVAVAMLPMIAIMGVIMGAMKLFELNKKDKELQNKIGENFKNANENYNAFAEKAGLATRSLVGLEQAAKESTMQLNRQNTTKEQALQVDDKERGNAQSSGYVSAMKINKDATSKEVANQIRMLVGKNADPAALAQAMSDVVAQKGATFQQEVQAAYAGAEANPYKTGLSNITSNYGRWSSGRTDASTAASGDLQGEMTRNVDEIKNIYGTQAGGVATLAEAKKLFDASKGGTDKERQAAADILSKMFDNKGITAETIGTKDATFEGFVTSMENSTFRSDKTKSMVKDYQDLQNKKVNLDNVDYATLTPGMSLPKQMSLEMSQRIAEAKGLG
ncbi:Phage tail tape measure protein, partial [uncultured Caudovirales phage]